MNNKFIVIEGIEGSGKTTAVNTVVNILKKKGIHNIITTREPGGTQVSEDLRSVIKKNRIKEKITEKTELLIIYAARIQLLETVIKPYLLKGFWIVSDRYDLSSQAYQGGGRGLLDLVNILKKKFLNNFSPDLTLYLDVTPEIGLSRIKKRKSIDYIEQESFDFFSRTRQKYLDLARKNKNIFTIDATKSITQVNLNINFFLNKWLKI